MEGGNKLSWQPKELKLVNTILMFLKKDRVELGMIFFLAMNTE